MMVSTPVRGNGRTPYPQIGRPNYRIKLQEQYRRIAASHAIRGFAAWVRHRLCVDKSANRQAYPPFLDGWAGPFQRSRLAIWVGDGYSFKPCSSS